MESKFGSCGFKPDGIAETLKRLHLDKCAVKYFRIEKKIHPYGVLVTRNNSNKKQVQMLCDQAAINGRVKKVSMACMPNPGGKNPRGSYIVGDAEDIAAFWADSYDGLTLRGVIGRQSDLGIFWSGLQKDHVWRPYLDFDFHGPDQDYFGVFWKELQTTLDIIKAAIEEMDPDCRVPSPLIMYNCREEEDGTYKFSFHVHYVGLLTEHIAPFKNFLLNLDGPRECSYDKEGNRVETKRPNYDMAVYGGREQLFRGPFCGKFGDGRTVMFPVSPGWEYGSGRPWRDSHDTKCERMAMILHARIRVPRGGDAYMLTFPGNSIPPPMPEPQEQMPHYEEKLAEETPYLEFFGPFIETEIIPAWQTFRRKQHALSDTTLPVYIPTDNLVIDKRVHLRPPGQLLLRVRGDTYCEIDANHTHRRSTGVINVILDFLNGKIWQQCLACRASGKRYNFIHTSGAFEIDPPELNTTNIFPPSKQKFFDVLIRYFTPRLVYERQTKTVYVHNKKLNIWVDNADGNKVVGQMCADLNAKYSRYVQCVLDVKYKKLLAELDAQFGPVDETNREEYLKKKERLRAPLTKMMTSMGEMCAYTPVSIGTFMQVISNYHIPNQVDEMNPIEHLVPMRDGNTFNVFTGEVQPIKVSDYFTSLVNAKICQDEAELKEVNDWFLEVSSGDMPKCDYLKRIGGYSMTMLTHDRKFYVLRGNGKNGKGIYKQFFVIILNGTHESPPRWFNVPPAYWEVNKNGGDSERASPNTYNFRHKTLYYSDDMNRNAIDCGLLKSRTANEGCTGRGLYKDPVHIVPKGKVMWTTNSTPNIPGEESAVYDRFVQIHMATKYVERHADVRPEKYILLQDTERVERLLTKSDAFFTICVQTLYNYYQTHGHGECFEIPPSVEKERKDARCKELPLARYMSRYMVETNQPVRYAEFDQVFDQYHLFLGHENEKATYKKCSKKEFEDLLINALNITCHNGMVVGWGFDDRKKRIEESPFGGTECSTKRPRFS